MPIPRWRSLDTSTAAATTGSGARRGRWGPEAQTGIGLRALLLRDDASGGALDDAGAAASAGISTYAASSCTTSRACTDDWSSSPSFTSAASSFLHPLEPPGILLRRSFSAAPLGEETETKSQTLPAETTHTSEAGNFRPQLQAATSTFEEGDVTKRALPGIDGVVMVFTDQLQPPRSAKSFYEDWRGDCAGSAGGSDRHPWQEVEASTPPSRAEELPPRWQAAEAAPGKSKGQPLLLVFTVQCILVALCLTSVAIKAAELTFRLTFWPVVLLIEGRVFRGDCDTTGDAVKITLTIRCDSPSTATDKHLDLNDATSRNSVHDHTGPLAAIQELHTCLAT
eukprot:SM000044S16057  [mRNA]  locus=s44:792645:795010:- [translate_table: standard]